MWTHRLVIKDAARQLIGRIASALLGFLVIKIMSPYLGPLRYGDYSTILKYFAIWSALADFGLYVIAVRKLWVTKELEEAGKIDKGSLQQEYGSFVGTRVVTMTIVYTAALILAYLLPAYTSNPYLVRGLPFGMAFSAMFMGSWITQLPLQLFWKMEQLSIGLIAARMGQLWVLAAVVYRWFRTIEFDWWARSVLAFCLIMGSVVVSSLIQRIYVQRKANKLLGFSIIIDRSFIKKVYLSNRQYGIAYYLSSFHTLIVLILLSNFFPTADGNIYTGVWALALSLIEILLIIPSSLGNSLLHKVAWYTHSNMRKSFGSFLSLIYWIGLLAFVNFLVFAEPIIHLVWGAEFIGTWLSNPWANTVLPFLAFVLLLSFIKQVYNYLFVAIEKNNDIFWVNLIGVIVGLWIGIYAIPRYALLGGIVTQVSLEVMYVLGALFIARYHKTQPFVHRGKLSLVTLILGVLWSWAYLIFAHMDIGIIELFVYGAGLNLVLIGSTIWISKHFARGLTME
jgi:O-antigen/teichoic acid export membrane protein